MRMIYNKDLEPIAMIPEQWGWHTKWNGPDGDPYVSFDLDMYGSRVWGDPLGVVDPNSTAPVVTIKVMNINGVLHMVCVDGLERLIAHKDVASFPAARSDCC